MQNRLAMVTLKSLPGSSILWLVAAVAGVQTATAQSLCENYLVLPSGQQVCFDNSPVMRERTTAEPLEADPEEPMPIEDPAAALSSLAANSDESYVAYLNQLESCTPSTTELPLPTAPDIQIRMTIQGSEASGCAVDMVLVDLEADVETPYLSCVYSPATLAVITDETGYTQASGLDAGTDSTSSGSTTQRSQVLSDAIATECSG